MTDTVLVRPRHGIILDGIPAKGAEIPKALALEWIADQLVYRVEQPTPTPAVRKPVRRNPKGSGSTRPRKQRRT